jgi:hypothetical protein
MPACPGQCFGLKNPRRDIIAEMLKPRLAEMLRPRTLIGMLKEFEQKESEAG